MCRPLRIHAPGVLHHIVARGDNKRCIFADDDDCRRFLDTLASVLDRFNVRCPGYCLMSNHYHLLVVPQAHPIWRVMQQLNSIYCQAFNRRHGRVGHVLQGRYGCRLVQDGEYARAAVRYVARNPVTAGRVLRPEAWAWSSYRAAIGLENAPAFLSLEHVWSVFGTADPDVGRARLIDFVGVDVEDPFPNPLLHGAEALARRAGAALEPQRWNGDFIYVERFAERPSLGTILAGRMDREQVDAAAHRAFHRYGYTLRELSQVLSRHPSTICRWIAREEQRQVRAGAKASAGEDTFATNKI